MILILGGTTEGRELAEELIRQGYACLLSVTSELGVRLAANFPGEILWGTLDLDGLQTLIQLRNINCIIDATHPHAAVIKATAQAAAVTTGISYVLLQRPEVSLPKHPDIRRVADYTEALGILQDTTGGILFTIGVKNLALFRPLWEIHSRMVWVKVYPEIHSLELCRDAGLRSEQIFAYHGPGSQPLFRAILEDTGAQWLVTKESGEVGGTPLKIAAALKLGRKVLLIERPRTTAGIELQGLEDVYKFLETNYKRG